jgi:hypothetical protein
VIDSLLDAQLALLVENLRLLLALFCEHARRAQRKRGCSDLTLLLGLRRGLPRGLEGWKRLMRGQLLLVTGAYR